ncbi:hypothetical protein PQX77_020167 [Marasmius sp. AFHP31]|nr:hypothetical protein PQX77_020167 [Marasmius sp. AFHP31]
MAFQALGAILLAAVAWTVFKLKGVGVREPGLPPGPPTTRLLGNIASFPKKFPYIKFTEWARIWGGLYSLKLGPATAIVITDATIIKEFIDKRGHTTSDRPANFIVESVSGGLDLALARYGRSYNVPPQIHMEVISLAGRSHMENLTKSRSHDTHTSNVDEVAPDPIRRVYSVTFGYCSNA